MRLGEVATYPEVVSLCGRVPMDLKWAWVTFSSRKCWRLPPWWEVGLKMEWLELEPCVSQGFSYAQWLSLPYQGQGQVPRCWSRSPKNKIKLIPPPLVWLSPPPSNSTLTPGEQHWSKEGPSGYPVQATARAGGWSPNTSQSSRPLLICCLHKTQ